MFLSAGYLFVFNVCMTISSKRSVLIVLVRCLHCLKFMLLFVEIQFKYSDNQAYLVLQPNIILHTHQFFTNSSVLIADYNPFAWLLAFVYSMCFSCSCLNAL